MAPYYNTITKPFILVLLLLISIISSSASSSSKRHLCLTEQHDALLQFKKTFAIDSYGCLTSWQNDTDCCMWNEVACDNKTGDVISLHLSWCWLQATSDNISSLVSLQNLQSLDLSGNQLHGSLSSFPQLPKLMHLGLSYCNLQGTIDNISPLVSLQNLQSLDLSGNQLNGSLSSFHQLPKLLHLDLSENYFAGIVPSEIAHLSQLISLNLTWNDDLIIPSSTLDLLIQNLTNIQELRLDGTRIDGFLSSSPFNLSTALTYLSLPNCSLRGRFPDYIFHLPNLHYLDVSQNLGLTGTLPSLNWSSPLLSLDLSSTGLSGNIHNSIGNLKNLKYLDLGSCHFTNLIPWLICSLSSLKELDLSNNTFSSLIPHCLGNLTNLQWLDMSHNQLTGPLPRSLNNCTLLEYMDVSSNMLRDGFPSWLGHLPKLRKVNLGQNRFYGLIDRLINVSSLGYLYLHQNSFSGHLPDFIRVPPSICKSLPRILDLSNNSLTAAIPPYLLNCSYAINLGMNKLEGAIPDVFLENSTITFLDLSSNKLTGPLPRSMGNCKYLELIDLSNNNIEDSFPNWLEALPKLQILLLQSNRFNGELKTLRDHPFPKLQLFDISNNNLTGLLPIKYFSELDTMKVDSTGFGYANGYGGNIYNRESRYDYFVKIRLTVKGSTFEFPKVLSDLKLIDFSNNHFQGEIPEAIGKLSGLKGLNLSHNNLTGSIPRSIQNLTSLEGLDLSLNQLSGVIPREFTDLTALEILNLSYNELSGRIPSGKQFDTFGKESFVGNTGLCGPQVEKSCGGESNNSKPPQLPLPPSEGDDFDTFDWKIILMGYGCGLIIGISIGYMVLELRRPEWFVLLVEEKLLMKIARLSRWKN